jgi:hypothetical protein
LNTAQDGADENRTDKEKTLLHAAAKEGNIEVAGSLLEWGVDVIEWGAEVDLLVESALQGDINDNQADINQALGVTIAQLAFRLLGPGPWVSQTPPYLPGIQLTVSWLQYH